MGGFLSPSGCERASARVRCRETVDINRRSGGLKNEGVGVEQVMEAVNRAVAAPATLLADLWAEGIVPHLTIHDELIFSVEDKASISRIREVMTTCVPDLKVPMQVDVEIGPTWGKTKETKI